MEKTSDGNKYDVIIAGAGISGILTAARLFLAAPKLKILLLEKEGEIGGRIIKPVLSGISPDLYDFILHTIAAMNAEKELAIDSCVGLQKSDASSSALFTQNKMQTISDGEIHSISGARHFGARLTTPEWEEFAELIKNPLPGRGSVQKVHKPFMKQPHSHALEKWAHYLGITEPLKADLASFHQRSDYCSHLIQREWQPLLAQLVAETKLAI